MINRLNEKYSMLSKPTRASIWFTITNFFQKGIVFISIPIFTRLLSLHEYGFYSIYITWMSILSIFTTLNLSSGGFNNAMIKFHNKKDDFLTSMIGLTLVLNLSLLLFYLAISVLLEEDIILPRLFMFFIFIETFFLSILSLWTQRQKFDYRYKSVTSITVGYTIITTLIGVLMVLVYESAISRIVANIFSILIISSVILYLVIKKSRLFYNKEFWKFALLFNVPLVPHYLSQIVLNQSDRIMISYFLSESFAAIYSVAYSVSMILSILIISINSSLTPWIYRNLKDLNYDDIRKATSKIITFIGIIVIIPIIIGPEIIYVLAPPEYRTAIWIIPPVGISVYFIFLYSIFASVEFFYGVKKYIVFGSLSVALLNILLNYVFIPRYGFISAGYTTLISYIVYSLIHFYLMKRVLTKNGKSLEVFDLRIIMITSVVLVVGSILFVSVYDLIIIRYLILFMSVIYIIHKRDFLYEFLLHKEFRIGDD